MSLTVVPYYNKPTQEGLYRHFRAIAEAVDMPHILYNVPGRTVADMQNETVLRLAEIPNIVGIKDATADLQRGAELLRRKPADFLVYSGDDGTGLALMLLGGDGVISVTANVAPRLMHEMCKARARRERRHGARESTTSCWACTATFSARPTRSRSNGPSSSSASFRGGIRLPLTPLASGFQNQVRDAMRQAGLLDAAHDQETL